MESGADRNSMWIRGKRKEGEAFRDALSSNVPSCEPTTNGFESAEGPGWKCGNRSRRGTPVVASSQGGTEYRARPIPPNQENNENNNNKAAGGAGR
jgi:hypothetical protein